MGEETSWSHNWSFLMGSISPFTKRRTGRCTTQDYKQCMFQAEYFRPKSCLKIKEITISYLLSRPWMVNEWYLIFCQAGNFHKQCCVEGIQISAKINSEYQCRWIFSCKLPVEGNLTTLEEICIEGYICVDYSLAYSIEPN